MRKYVLHKSFLSSVLWRYGIYGKKYILLPKMQTELLSSDGIGLHILGGNMGTDLTLLIVDRPERYNRNGIELCHEINVDRDYAVFVLIFDMLHTAKIAPPIAVEIEIGMVYNLQQLTASLE